MFNFFLVLCASVITVYAFIAGLTKSDASETTANSAYNNAVVNNAEVNASANAEGAWLSNKVKDVTNSAH